MNTIHTQQNIGAASSGFSVTSNYPSNSSGLPASSVTYVIHIHSTLVSSTETPSTLFFHESCYHNLNSCGSILKGKQEVEGFFLPLDKSYELLSYQIYRGHFMSFLKDYLHIILSV